MLICLTSLTSIYLIIDFFEKLRKFLRYDAELTSVLMYFLFKIPDISFKIAPFAAIMATLLTIGLFNKNNEITAMRSCGLSLSYFSLPFIVTGILFTLIFFIFTTLVIPFANSNADYIKTVEIQRKPQPLSFTNENLWLRMQNNSIMKIKKVMPTGTRLESIQLYRLDPNFQLSEMILAENATYSLGQWSLSSVTKRKFKPNGLVIVTSQNSEKLELSLTPKDLKTWNLLEPEHMTIHQLGDHIAHLKKEGQNISAILTDYWGRIALAFATLTMTILGLSIGLLNIGSTARMAKGIAQALGISFLFWTAHSIGIALGHGGALVPFLAGWIACFMFLFVSLNFFLKVSY